MRLRELPIMSRFHRQRVSGLLALATILAAGCLPRGPFPPAAMFGEGDGSECCNGRSCGGCHRAGNHGRPDVDTGNVGQPPLTAPISNFHPVPTRPVFTPWLAEEPVAEEIAGPLAWRQAANRSAVVNPENLPSDEDHAKTQIARRPIPPAANLPDEDPGALPADKRAGQPSPEWHAPGPRF
jgi:hypothetical protein